MAGTTTRKPRGTYAKGDAKRDQIVQRAMEAFAKTGYHGTSMREIAQACDLSQAGLLHHFPNKEAILLAIVDRRERSHPQDPMPDLQSTLTQVDRNIEEIGLTRLWANLVGEATDPDFPAHAYFKDRYRKTRAGFAQTFATMGGRSEPNAEDQTKAAVFTAIWDGLQTQSLLDDDFDMKAAFAYAVQLMSR